ncbi:unnamed protein product [Arabidopsis lyrata]|uniref:Predicted protein n=1 Tax=Arabidopsis lyrata subsp. lyrata TaxID=81972 RepID=D7M302_ARALL|nr:predicted protein [Arabidopsis lyrata subsp. lyrata]CAH8270706.1 unnamed protein product [Arabidopsis lyrata]
MGGGHANLTILIHSLAKNYLDLILIDTHHLFSETKIALAGDVAEKLKFKNNETDVDGSMSHDHEGLGSEFGEEEEVSERPE